MLCAYAADVSRYRLFTLLFFHPKRSINADPFPTETYVLER